MEPGPSISIGLRSSLLARHNLLILTCAGFQGQQVIGSRSDSAGDDSGDLFLIQKNNLGQEEIAKPRPVNCRDQSKAFSVLTTCCLSVSPKCGPMGRLNTSSAIRSVRGKAPDAKPSSEYAACRCGGHG